MKRRIFKLCLFLLLGALINVAVAWGFALRACPMRSVNYLAGGVPRLMTSVDLAWLTAHGWKKRADPDGFKWEYVADDYSTIGYRDTVLSAALVPDEDFSGSRMIRFQPFAMHRVCGWPVATFYDQAMESGATPQPSLDWNRTEYGLHLRVLHGLVPMIPVPSKPLWADMILNSLMYAFIIYVLWSARMLFWIRRQWRIKRGLCPACAYPVGASDVCTECGKPVRITTVT